MKRLIGSLVFTLCAIALIGCGDTSGSSGKVQVDPNAKPQDGKGGPGAAPPPPPPPPLPGK